MKSLLYSILLTVGFFTVTNIASAQIAEDVTINYIENTLVTYPNPTNGMIHILLRESASRNVLVDIMDLSGQTVRSYTYPTGSAILDVDLGNLPFGLYSINVFEAGNVLENIKVVKY